MPCYELCQANSATVVPQMEENTCIVLHHMDGCIHCSLFKPVWKQVTDQYKSKKPYTLISVEYSSAGLLPKSMQNVQGFPTLRAYKNAKPIAEFNDARTYDAVVEFVEKYGKNGDSSASKPAKKAPTKAPAKKVPAKK